MAVANTIFTVVGILIGFIGSYILSLPNLDRDCRQHFYRMAPYLRSVYKDYETVGEMPIGASFSTENDTVCYTLIDHFDHPLRSIRDETPTRVELVATEMLLTYSNGEEERHGLGNQSPKTVLYETLEIALERRCRMMGIAIAFIGAVIAIVGAAI